MIYLYLGGDTVVECDDIVGLFDLDNTTASLNTRKLLSRVQKNNAVIAATDDIPRSVVLCTVGGEERVYLSLLSTAALQRRLEEEPWR